MRRPIVLRTTCSIAAEPKLPKFSRLWNSPEIINIHIHVTTLPMAISESQKCRLFAPSLCVVAERYMLQHYCGPLNDTIVPTANMSE